jgi:muramidase (phage lysozyme)
VGHELLNENRILLSSGVGILARRLARKLSARDKKKSDFALKWVTVVSSIAAVALLFWLISWQAIQRQPFNYFNWQRGKKQLSEPRLAKDLLAEILVPQKTFTSPADVIIPPLMMSGGDPYIRALMRTISASESNEPNPYAVLYGGKQVHDLTHHPQLCVTIVTGPNRGRCTTAAGRYQMLYKTWVEKAERYHPKPSPFLFWTGYSFEPEYQDSIVHAWLSDRQAWGVDVSKLLREGKIDQVLRLLSGTWTSLGYGKEDNSMTQYLPEIYQRMLKQELQVASQN